MVAEDLLQRLVMRHMLDVLENREDIGQYGRLCLRDDRVPLRAS